MVIKGYCTGVLKEAVTAMVKPGLFLFNVNQEHLQGMKPGLTGGEMLKNNFQSRFGPACLKRTIPVPGSLHLRRIKPNMVHPHIINLCQTQNKMIGGEICGI